MPSRTTLPSYMQVGPVHDGERFAHVVVGDDDAQVRLLAQGKDDLLHLGHGDGIDAAERLVEHQQARVGDERARDGQPALLAAAQGQREVARDVRDAELFEQFVAARPAVACG